MNDYGYASNNAGAIADTAHLYGGVLPRVASRVRKEGAVRTVRNGPRVLATRLVNAACYLSIGLMGAALAYGAYIY